MKLPKLILLALFVSLALVLSFVEGTLPMPLPGMKLGAANVFALAALVMMGPREAFTVTILRIILAWLLTGNLFALFCSMTGGVLSTAVMALLYTKFRGLFSIPWISVAGAWAFNAGQILVATALIGDVHVLYYLLPLILAGTAAGWAVGLLAQILCNRLKKYVPSKRGWRSMKISIDKDIFAEFPDAGVGYLIAAVEVRDGDPYVDGVKKTLERKMNEIGISADTMMNHPDVQRWRDVFSKMGAKPSKYRSSLEALLRRLFKGELWSVSNVVDLYDCVSALNLLPMGAHDVDKLKGGLTLRFGREGETFAPLGAGEAVVAVDPRNVVYADEEKITCWLWNHRDTREAAVSCQTKTAIFLVDRAFDTEWRTLEQGLRSLAGELEKIGAEIIASGVVDAKNPSSEAALHG